MRDFKKFVVVFFLLLACIIFGRSDASPGNHLDITYMIPDKYEGLLLVVYDMPGGVLYPIESKEITITFDQDRIARVGNINLLWGMGKSVAKDAKSGAEIPMVGRKTNLIQPLPSRAVIRTFGVGVTATGRREVSFDVFVVGDPKNFPDTMDPYLSYKKDVEILLSKYLGPN